MAFEGGLRLQLELRRARARGNSGPLRNRLGLQAPQLAALAEEAQQLGELEAALAIGMRNTRKRRLVAGVARRVALGEQQFVHRCSDAVLASRSSFDASPFHLTRMRNVCEFGSESINGSRGALFETERVVRARFSSVFAWRALQSRAHAPRGTSQ